jgi:hypothetical protein
MQTPIGKQHTLDHAMKEAKKAADETNPATPVRQEITIPGYLNPAGSNTPGYGIRRPACVDIKLIKPEITLYGIMVTSDTNSAANAYTEDQRFQVTIPSVLYTKMQEGKNISNDEVAAIKATPIAYAVNEVHEVDAPDPINAMSKLTNAFSGTKQTYSESTEALKRNCEMNPPATLAQAISRLKQKSPNTLKLIPSAAQLKQGRFNQNIYDGPVCEVNRHGVKIKTADGAGIKAEGKSTVLSGKVFHEGNDDIYPQQITGIPSEAYPLDDFIPKGNVLMPHTKRFPAVLMLVQSVLPVLEGVSLAITLSKALKDL